MRITVAGGTGLVSRVTIEVLRGSGHDAIVLARSVGVDMVTGAGLADALVGVDAVIDVTNTPTQYADTAREFFTTTTNRLPAAEQKAGVGHHVVLSIVGLDRVKGNGHYAGKRCQEELALAGPIPVSVVRATQFFEFAGMVVKMDETGRRCDCATSASAADCTL